MDEQDLFVDAIETGALRDLLEQDHAEVELGLRVVRQLRLGLLEIGAGPGLVAEVVLRDAEGEAGLARSRIVSHRALEDGLRLRELLRAEQAATRHSL